MVDLAGFARRMRVLADQVVDGTDLVTRATAVAASETVTLATPVDTGRARGNWQIGLGTPVRRETDANDRSGQETITRNSRRVAARVPGQTIFISNNVPYIVELNAGSSSQAPAGFVEEAVQAAVAAARRVRILA